MPSPCPQVIEDLFDLYEKSKEPERNTLFGWLKDAAEKAVSYIQHEEPPLEMRRNIQARVKSKSELIKVKRAVPLELWVDLIFVLGQEATDKLKFFKDTEKQSRFFETLHAMRSYIIHSLTAENDIFKNKFEEYIVGLRQQTHKIHEALVYTVKYDNGRNAEELYRKYQENILHLSFLEDKKSIIAARKAGLLDYLNVYSYEKLVGKYKIPAQFANAFIPFCLQTKFIETLYENEYQTVNKTYGFEKLETLAIKKSGFKREDTKLLDSEISLEPSINTCLQEVSHRTLQKKFPPNESETVSLGPVKIPKLWTQILKSFFELYDATRAPDRNSTTGMLINVAEKIKGSATGKDTTIAEIETMKVMVIADIHSHIMFR